LNRATRAAAAIILPTIILTGLLGCTAKADPAAAGQTATVQRGNLNINILASGNLLTSHEENMAFYSAGTVTQVLVKIGDRVQTRQVLAKLDTAPLESSLAQAAISVKSAQMDLENAKEPKTNSSGAVIATPDPLNIEIKELQLENAQADQAEAQKKLDKATITAPFAGLVTDVNVVPGDQVSANAVGVRIIDPANFQTDVLVNEMEIYELSLGTPATVQAVALPTYTFPAKIALIAETPTIQSNVVNYKVTVQMDPVNATLMQAQATQRATGSASARTRPPGTGGQTAITQPGSAATTDNRTLNRQLPTGTQSLSRASGNQTATFAGRQSTGQAAGAGGQQVQTATVPPDFRLREGLTVTVSIIAEQRTDILLVPNKAITSRGGRYYVQLVSAGTTQEKMIQAGITDGQNTELISGLNEGDVVSTATNIAAPATTNNSQQRVQTPSIPGVRLPGR
jgi:RND family efflux transporter MFP subunit